MKQLLILFLAFVTLSSMAQELPKEKLYEAKKQLRAGNDVYEKGKFDEAAIAYQKSLAEDGTYYKGAYNLGNAYFQQKKYKEAVEQYELANKLAKSNEDKAKTSELIGDSFIKQKELEKALEAYKQALLKDSKNDILRQKFIAAKQEKQKQDQQKKDDKNKDDKDQDKDKKDDKDSDKNKDGKNDKNKDNKDGDKKDDKDGDNKEDKKDKESEKPEDKEGDKEKNKSDKEKGEQPQAAPKKSKLSPEQIKQLLENMNNEEQKTQKKVNAQKVKGKPSKNEKDW